jgi:hypothetical protein
VSDFVLASDGSFERGDPTARIKGTSATEAAKHAAITKTGAGLSALLKTFS